MLLKKIQSFTLIELLITMSIIILLAAAAGPALKIHQDRANLDTAVIKLKDAILETQNYAFAPERENVDGYLFVLNMSESNTASYAGKDLLPRSYGIFAMVGSNRYLIKKISIDAPVILESSSLGYIDSVNDFFKIHFRVKDGAAGCSAVYYDFSQWGNTCVSDGDNYAAVRVKLANKTKTIKIHKITGQIQIE